MHQTEMEILYTLFWMNRLPMPSKILVQRGLEMCCPQSHVWTSCLQFLIFFLSHTWNWTLGILHSSFRILSPRVIHWGQEVSKLECWVHCGLVKMIKWPRAVEGGRVPTSALILTHVWVEAVFFPEKGKLKSQHGTVSKGSSQLT